MGRPAKAVSSKVAHDTKEEIAIRRDAEEKLRGGKGKLRAPTYLNKEQKKIFRYIVNCLEESEILGNLDIYILSVASVTIANLIELDTMINDEPDKLTRVKLMQTRDKYTKDFFRCCNELSLSPQARAKLSIANVREAKESKNPIMEVLEL